MDTFWLTVLAQTQTLFILIGVTIFILTPRSGRPEVMELGIILVISVITELLLTFGHFVLHINMNIVANIFNLVNLPLALLLYRRKIHWKNSKLISHVLIGAFLVFGLVNLFFVQGPFPFNSYTPAFAAVIFIITSLTYFYVLIQQLPTESITRLPMFWANTAILIYYSGTFFLYLSADYLTKVLNNNLIIPWIIHNFLGLIYYSVLWICLWQNRAATKLVAA